VPPTLSGVTLTRQFLRVMAVDLDWHLLGNRSAGILATNIPGDDSTVPDFLLPAVRDPVPNFAYLPDAQEVLGTTAAMTAAFGGQPSTFAAVASPVIDDAMAAPAQPGAQGHWPAFPPFAAPQPISPATRPAQGLTATRRSAADGANADRDVIVTIAAGALPDGAHVRVFPRLFQEIQAIGNVPSFVRPDGGAAIAQTGAATKILLVNAFGLGPADNFPSPANLVIDVVVTDRNLRRRMFSQVTVTVAAGPESAAGIPANFGGTPLLGAPALKGVLDGLGMRGVAASPLFGVPRTTTLPTPGGSVMSFVRALASETRPRQGPRLPTMMRFDSILAVGSAAAADTPLAWSAVLTGVRLTNEARSFRPDLGNPGNPAGPDVHAVGIRCDGFLARDLALHAVKRAQPIIPLGGATAGWVIATGGNNWNPPPADTTGTVAAVMLETVAAICDTPELSIGATPEPQPGDTVQALVDSAAAALGVGTVPVNVANANEIVRRVQPEIVTAKHGQRDALWALRRAFGQARELIYIETPGLARTARPVGAPAAHEIDLIDVIRTQLVANPRLKVIICTPRLPDFDTEAGGSAEPWPKWARMRGMSYSAANGLRIGVTSPLATAVAQNFAHASIKCRRFWNRSPRLYAASTLSLTVCANAISRTSAGKLVRSLHQSENVDLKPCAVRSPRLMRRSNIKNAMLLSGRRALAPGNTKSLWRTFCISARIESAVSDSGTRCSLPAFMRSPGTTHSRSTKLISSQRAPINSPVRAAVRMANSSAHAATPSCRRSSGMNLAISA